MRMGGFTFRMLSVIACEETAEGKVLIQIRPMEAEGRNLDPVQLLGRPERQPGIASHWKSHLSSALHRNYDLPVLEDGRPRAIG